MRDFNNQILDYLNKVQQLDKLILNEIEINQIENSMSVLKFGYPVNNIEELNEVVKNCIVYDNLINNPNPIIERFEKNLNQFDISLSLTDCCGHNCLHCSTNASLEKSKKNVSFEKINKAFNEISPHVNCLYISCEGDPFYYESITKNDKNEWESKNLVDIIQLLMDYKFKAISVQCTAPTGEKLQILKDFLEIIDQQEKEYLLFYPQISFNLYPPRAGLKIRNQVDESGFEYKELYIPSINQNEIKQYFLNLINGNYENSININLPDLKKVSKNLAQYFNEVKNIILEYAARNYKIHFEIRGDSINEFTSPETLDYIFNTLLERLAEEHPEINFPTCNHCSKVHYDYNFSHIVPLGRGVNLIPDGVNKEKDFFDKHVKINPYKYLCDNWVSWGSMVIDTKGFPQLCYSNLALTPKARTTEGPNLYKDGFEAICDFYIKVWEARMDFLKENMPELVRKRPNDHYCPLVLFKKTLSEFI